MVNKNRNDRISYLFNSIKKFFIFIKLSLLEIKNKRKNKVIEKLVMTVYERLLVKFRSWLPVGVSNIR